MSDQFSKGHALVVGVGADLPDTVTDAVGVSGILTDPGRCAYPKDQVRLLISEEATRQGVLAALDELAQNTAAESTAVVYFSGHGHKVTSTLGEAYFLIPYGVDPGKLYQTAIRGDEFADKLAAIPAQKLLLLLDCCFAGGVGDLKAPGIELAPAPVPPEALQLFSQGAGRVLIASSREDEYSMAGKPYSAFTLALIEALCGAGVAKKDGYVRVADLALHAREVVPARTGKRQHPILHWEHADNYPFAYYAGGDPQPKALPFTAQPEIEPEAGAWRRAQQVTQTGDGVQVVGDHNLVVGERGVNVGGDVSGNIVTGDHNNIRDR